LKVLKKKKAPRIIFGVERKELTWGCKN
jgi:hypothetical protein